MSWKHVASALAVGFVFAAGSAAAGEGGGSPEAGKTYTNSIGMEFILVPAGSFQMGSGPDDYDCGGREDECNDEKPRHNVTISRPFYLGKHEVTQKQWEAVMGNNPSYEDFRGADRPVDSVSWQDAQKFIRRLNEKEGHKRYRLPTEAEWEYAARAGTTTPYYFGDYGEDDEDNPVDEYGWCLGSGGGGETHPVGLKKPNAWGFYDMYGNVEEWVSDWYSNDYYSAKAVVDPKGPPSGEYRVLRGGSWLLSNVYPTPCNSTTRNFGAPDDNTQSWVGFRLALTPER